MADSTHLQLPLLASDQAQKHVTHNDAVLRLDALVQLSVKDRDLTAPSGAPADGDRYIPASGATGAWAGWDLNIAWYHDGVWTKLVPREGWTAWVDDENQLLIHDGARWISLDSFYVLKAGDTISGMLTVDLSAGVMPAPPAATALHVKGAVDSATRLVIDTMGTGVAHAPNLAYRWARNSGGSPAPVNNNDILGLFSWFGYGATGYSAAARAQLRGIAAEAWTDTAQGTRLALFTSAIGTAAAAERFGVEADGALSMGGSANKVIDENRHHRLRSYTVATLPSASPAGQMIYVSNEVGGATPAFSDGTNWRRVADCAIVS